MAFTPDTLNVIVQPVGGGGIRMFSYNTDDDADTVTGTDYFVRGEQHGIRVSDLIFVAPLTGSFDPFIVNIEVVDDEGNATGDITQDLLNVYRDLPAVSETSIPSTIKNILIQAYDADVDPSLGRAWYKEATDDEYSAMPARLRRTDAGGRKFVINEPLIRITTAGTADDWAAAAVAARDAYPDAPIVLERGGDYAYEQNVTPNLYGGSVYKDALGLQLLMGTKAVPITRPEPILWVEKVVATDEGETPVHDQGAAYFSSEKRAGASSAYGSSSYLLYRDGAQGFGIGHHSRIRINASGENVFGYGQWNYVIIGETFEPRAAHACEMNGSNFSGIAPLYNDPDKAYQILRLVMVDNFDGTNVFSTALSIGTSSTLTGENGVHIGVHFERSAVRSYASSLGDGELIRMDIPMAAGRSYGGIRFAVGDPGDAGTFRYALRTDEVSFNNNNAILLGTSQHIRWGDHSSGGGLTGPRLTGTSNSIALGSGFLNIANPVSGTAIQVEGTKVLGSRIAGFVTAAGSANKDASGINVGTITATDANIRALAAWTKAIGDALLSHGIIGA